jgi:hypothetical protein
MGKEWDRSSVAFRPETWAAVLRVLKPGAHMLCILFTIKRKPCSQSTGTRNHRRH